MRISGFAGAFSAVVGVLLLASAMPGSVSAVLPFGSTLSPSPGVAKPSSSSLRLRGGSFPGIPGFGGNKDKDGEEKKKKEEAEKKKEEERRIQEEVDKLTSGPAPMATSPPPSSKAADEGIDAVRSKLAQLKAEVKGSAAAPTPTPATPAAPAPEKPATPAPAAPASPSQTTPQMPVFTPAPAPQAPKVPEAETGKQRLSPRMMQTVTRSESYSVLDEAHITSILRSPSQVPEEAKEAEEAAQQKPLPVAETQAQPAPPKGLAEAWIKAAQEAIQRAKTAPKPGAKPSAPTAAPSAPTVPSGPTPTSPPPAPPSLAPATPAAPAPKPVAPAPPTLSDAPAGTVATAAPDAQVADAVAAVEEAIEEQAAEEDGKFRIVIVSSEVAPFSKSGGLADVADKLAVALSQMGHRVMTVSPSYRQYEGAVGTDVRRAFNLYGGSHDVHYTHKWEPTDRSEDPNPAMGVDRVFVQNAAAFERAGMYGDPGGHDYFDNLFRFALFSWAALEAPLILPAIAPFGEKVVFIANDWQCGLVPLILASHFRRWRVFGPARCLFIIHNMGYHGNFPNPQMYNYDLPDPRETPKWSFQDLGLADNAYYDMFKWIFPEQQRGDGGEVDDGECIKLLLGGIMMADRVVTVSPSYKEEIMSDMGGWDLQNNVRQRGDRLDGILNGIDTQQWDPETDKFLPANFNAKNLTGKAVCKQRLQESLGLHQNPDAPLIAFIGRLAPQKGVDVIAESFGWMMGGDDQGVLGDCQLVMMGSGQHEYAEFMRSAEGQHKGRVCGYVGFSSEMEHLIIAGADVLLMPSRYEPCGLPQMYAQRYGTVPVVHATGGLKDSVDQYEFAETGSKGTGWKFGNCDANGLRWGLWNALHVCKKQKEEWAALIQRGMARDFSWRKSAEQYVQLMDWAMMDPPRCEPWPFQH